MVKIITESAGGATAPSPLDFEEVSWPDAALIAFQVQFSSVVNSACNDTLPIAPPIPAKSA